MGKLLKGWTLDNGLVLEVHDESTQYYADFWNLKVVIKGKVKPECLQDIIPSSQHELEAKKALQEDVEYYRELTQIGVREAKLAQNIRRLLQHFEKNSLPYLQHPSFPEKMVRTGWREWTRENKIGRSREDEGG